MLEKAVFAIASVVLVSLVSFVGAVTLFLNRERVKTILTVFVGLSVGTLLGGAIFHLLPEALEKNGGYSYGLGFLILLGVIVFFALDNLIHWHHSHNLPEKHSVTEKPNVAFLNFFGDGVHNFMDGLIIAGSFMISIPLGITTTLAVILHEIPQELADFGVLIYSGLKTGRALMLNFYSATLAILGASIGLLFGSQSDIFLKLILPFGVGSFIYIGCSNLIPELIGTKVPLKNRIFNMLFIITGLVIMYLLVFLE